MSSHGTSRTLHAQQQVAGPVVAGHVPQATRTARARGAPGGRGPVVGGAYRGGVAVARADHAPDRVGRHARLVAERDHHRLAVRQLRQPARQRGRLALVPALARRRLRAVEVDRRRSPPPPRAEHHDHTAHGRGGHRAAPRARAAAGRRARRAACARRSACRRPRRARSPPITRPPRGCGRPSCERRPPSRPFRPPPPRP